VVALTAGNGIVAPIESGIEVHGRIPALLHFEGCPADARGRDHRTDRGLRRVRATRILKEVLDLIDVVASAGLSGARECCAHDTILPYGAWRSAQ
jgi:hypothetical protein